MYDPDRLINGTPAHAVPGTQEYNDKMAGIDIYAKAGVTTAPATVSTPEQEKEEYIKTIVEAIPETPIPYDEAHPFAFDEALARAASEQEWVPHYQELLNDYLGELAVVRERGGEDLERQVGDVERELSEYLTDVGIKKDRLYETKELYTTEGQLRLARIAEDRAQAVSDAAIAEQRAEESYDLIGEQYGLQKERLTTDEERNLRSLAAGEKYYLGKESRAFDEALRLANEGFAGKNIFFSGIRGKELERMGTEREAGLGEYGRRIGEQREAITTGAERGREDIDLALEEYGMKHGWTQQDIQRTLQEAEEGFGRAAEDVSRALEEYGLKYGWSLEDIELAQSRATQAGTRQTGLLQLGYGRTMSDLERQEALKRKEIQRQRTAAVETGVTTRRGEEVEEYEAGRQKYYQSYLQPYLTGSYGLT